MNFEFYKLGNRIGIKTNNENKTNNKVTYLTFEDARKTLKKIKQNGWNVKLSNEVKLLL